METYKGKRKTVSSISQAIKASKSRRLSNRIQLLPALQGKFSRHRNGCFQLHVESRCVPKKLKPFLLFSFSPFKHPRMTSTCSGDPTDLWRPWEVNHRESIPFFKKQLDSEKQEFSRRYYISPSQNVKPTAPKISNERGP